jgi:arylsulfatase A-like enzyme
VTTAQDLYPTIASAVEVSLESDQRLDGKNVWPGLRDTKPQDRGPFMIAGSDMAIFDGDWKLVQTLDGRVSLFNLKMDPREATNVWAANVEVGQRMQRLLAENASAFPSFTTRRGHGPVQISGLRRPNPR